MTQPTFDFSAILASSAHDMKNSLCLLIQLIEEVSEQVPQGSATENMAKVHYEAQRINSAYTTADLIPRPAGGVAAEC